MAEYYLWKELTKHRQGKKRYEIEVYVRGSLYSNVFEISGGDMWEILAMAENFMVHNNFEDDKLEVRIIQRPDEKD